MLKKFVHKKEDGSSELITSILVIAVLIALIAFMIDMYADLKIKDRLDTTLREYTLSVESTSKLSVDGLIYELSEDANNSIDDWTVTVYVDGTANGPYSYGTGTITISSDYGDKITLAVEGTVTQRTARWVSMFDTSGNTDATYSAGKSTTSKH